MSTGAGHVRVTLECGDQYEHTGRRFLHEQAWPDLEVEGECPRHGWRLITGIQERGEPEAHHRPSGAAPSAADVHKRVVKDTAKLSSVWSRPNVRLSCTIAGWKTNSTRVPNVTPVTPRIQED